MCIKTYMYIYLKRVLLLTINPKKHIFLKTEKNDYEKRDPRHEKRFKIYKKKPAFSPKTEKV